MKYKINLLLVFFVAFLGNLLSGQTFEDLDKFEKEYKDILNKKALQKSSEITNAENEAKSRALPSKMVYSRKDISALLSSTKQLLDELEFYKDSIDNMPYAGYEIFTQRDSIPFWQNIPAPKDYILGPGDEVIISVWGESESYNEEIINRDGEIYIKNIGLINLSNKSLIDAKWYLLSKFSRVYSTLSGESPKSFIDITLGELKSINVHFVGSVNIPGVHLLHPFSNVVSGLIQAGGVSEDGSLRKIKVLRNNKVVKIIDLYDYMFLGKPINYIRLMDQDIVYAPPRHSTVAITGSIRKQGYYEIIDGEKLDKLLSFSGNVNEKASETILIYKQSSSSDNSGFLGSTKEASKYEIVSGDSVFVLPISKIKKFVRIEGQIKNPGEYPFEPGMSLEDLISATSTLNDREFIKTINFSNIVIHRRNPEGVKPLLIEIDFNKEIKLENGDHISIGPSRIYQPIESIIITGEIEIPGVFPVNNTTTLGDAIKLAGGITKNALKDGIEIFRDSLKVAWIKDSFVLEKGDSLNILKKTGLVLVKGEVNNPGYVSFNKGDKIKKYINRAGGFSAFAEKSDIYVIYPNGNSIPKSSVSSPKIKEGSVIIVNQRALSGNRALSGWGLIGSISNQAGSLATTLLSLVLIMNQISASNG